MEKYYRVSDINEILNKLAKEPYYQHEDEDFYSGICAVEGELICLESVEHEESKVAKWIDSDPMKWECSNCHYKVERWNNTLYCPTCGAKMIKES